LYFIYKEDRNKKKIKWLGMVAYACIPSHLSDRDQEEHCLRPALTTARPHLDK
jgi:hypothetical protein